MRNLIKLLRDTRGVGAIEYALVASLISVAAIAAFDNLGGAAAANMRPSIRRFKRMAVGGAGGAGVSLLPRRQSFATAGLRVPEPTFIIGVLIECRI